MQRSDDFVGVNRRQNESGVLRGGWSFRDDPRWGSVQNEHDHILWMVSNQSTKSVGFTGKIPLYVKFVKRRLEIYGNKVERVGLLGWDWGAMNRKNTV